MAYYQASRTGGQLEIIPNTYFYVPNTMNNNPIWFQALPTVTDGKGAKYDPTPVIGRATPLLTYANSDLRTINVDFTFLVTKTNGDDLSETGVGTVNYNLASLRAIASSVYPRKGGQGVTYKPPVVCIFWYGSFLNKGRICVIVDKYSVKNDPSVPSDPATLCPYKFTVNVSMIKVYSSNDLPNQETIWNTGV